jgi:hypothetical protein
MSALEMHERTLNETGASLLAKPSLQFRSAGILHRANVGRRATEWTPTEAELARAGRRHLLLYLTRVLVRAPAGLTVWAMLEYIRSALENYNAQLRGWYAEHPGSRDPRTGDFCTPFPQ